MDEAISTAYAGITNLLFSPKPWFRPIITHYGSFNLLPSRVEGVWGTCINMYGDFPTSVRKAMETGGIINMSYSEYARSIPSSLSLLVGSTRVYLRYRGCSLADFEWKRNKLVVCDDREDLYDKSVGRTSTVSFPGRGVVQRAMAYRGEVEKAFGFLEVTEVKPLVVSEEF